MDSFLKIAKAQSKAFLLTKGFHRIQPIETAGGFFIVNAAVKQIQGFDPKVLASLGDLEILKSSDFQSKPLNALIAAPNASADSTSANEAPLA